MNAREMPICRNPVGHDDCPARVRSSRCDHVHFRHASFRHHSAGLCIIGCRRGQQFAESWRCLWPAPLTRKDRTRRAIRGSALSSVGTLAVRRVPYDFPGGWARVFYYSIIKPHSHP